MSDIDVVIEPRVRLVSAVLAAALAVKDDDPGSGQQSVTTAIRAYIQDYADHPAVVALTSGLETGGSVESYFAAALCCSWPTFEPQEPLPPALDNDDWPELLADFYIDTALAAFLWANQEPAWRQAVTTLRHELGGPLIPLLSQMAGRPLNKALRATPNLGYPSDQILLAETSGEMMLIVPPGDRPGTSQPLGEIGYALLDRLLAEQLEPLAPRDREMLLRAGTALLVQRAQGDVATLAFLSTERNRPWTEDGTTRDGQDFSELAAVTEALRTQLEIGGALSDAVTPSA